MTQYYDFYDNFESFKFENSKIAICPLSGEWKTNKTDSLYYKIPELSQYPSSISNELTKKRPCLQVIPPERVVSLIPDIEFIVFKHRFAYKKISAIDSVAFKYVMDNTQADFLFFIDWIEFRAVKQTTGITTSTYKTVKIRYQIWDLSKCRLLYMAESTGMGMDYADLMKNLSSKSTITEVTKEILKNMPECKNTK
jgi:hypothetical protein